MIFLYVDKSFKFTRNVDLQLAIFKERKLVLGLQHVKVKVKVKVKAQMEKLRNTRVLYCSILHKWLYHSILIRVMTMSDLMGLGTSLVWSLWTL